MQSAASKTHKTLKFASVLRRVTALAVLPAVFIMLSGCWNYREVDGLLVVAGFALDRGEEGHRYHVTVDIADTSKAGKDKPVQSAPLESDGDSIIDAVNNCALKAGLQLYWPNCQLAVVSQDVAMEGITPLIDWLNRDPGIRMTLEVLVSGEPSAKEVLLGKSPAMQITSFEIDKAYELNELLQPVAEYKYVSEIYNILGGTGQSLTLPVIRLATNGGIRVPLLDGMAIFDKDRLVAFLSAKDSRFAMYATNHVRGGTLDVKAPTGNNSGSLIVFDNHTKMIPKYQDGKLTLTVETRTETAVDELDTKMDLLDKKNIGQFEYAAEKQLAEHIAATIHMVQTQCGVDIFGFGDVMHHSDPAAWGALQKDWNAAFRTAKVVVSSKIDIRNKQQSRSSIGGGG